jgi:hypothetical protein
LHNFIEYKGENMAVNKYLLQTARQSVKKAFAPPQGGGAPPMDPSMMGGAPPMDPSMMGGAPPQGGGAPPMDPSMMGGAPPQGGGAPPMDPSMMGGAPPVDPAEQIRSVVQEELQKALSAAKGGNGKGSVKKDGGNTELYMHRIQKLLTHLYSSLGLNLPHDILDDVPKQTDGAQPAPTDGGAPPKTASYIPTAEKAAGIMHLLRKLR